jgi:hypothetical protein
MYTKSCAEECFATSSWRIPLLRYQQLAFCLNRGMKYGAYETFCTFVPRSTIRRARAEQLDARTQHARVSSATEQLNTCASFSIKGTPSLVRTFIYFAGTRHCNFWRYDGYRKYFDL